MVLISISHSSTITNENLTFKVGCKLLQLDLWKILDGHYYGGPAIFHHYNYSLK